MAIQAAHGFSLWVAREKSTGAVVGDCGLQPLELPSPDVELGYRLGRRHWGRGLATEAATACLRTRFEKLGLNRIVAVAHPDNAASPRVLEKAVALRCELLEAEVRRAVAAIAFARWAPACTTPESEVGAAASGQRPVRGRRVKV